MEQSEPASICSGTTCLCLPTTIHKLFHRHHVGPISQKKYRPGPKPDDAPLRVPGRSVQLDVKFVPRAARARQRFYQFTAIDEATRYRCCASTTTTTPERPFSFFSRSGSISPLLSRRSRRTTTRHSGRSSRGTFRTWVSPTSTSHLVVPK